MSMYTARSHSTSMRCGASPTSSLDMSPPEYVALEPHCRQEGLAILQQRFLDSIEEHIDSCEEHVVTREPAGYILAVPCGASFSSHAPSRSATSSSSDSSWLATARVSRACASYFSCGEGLCSGSCFHCFPTT